MTYIYTFPWTFWLIYALGAFGFAYIAGHSKITLPLRVFLGGAEEESTEDTILTPAVKPAIPGLGPFIAALLECPACLGFWEGVVIGYAAAVGTPGNPFFAGFIMGCATSGSNFILARATGLI